MEIFEKHVFVCTSGKVCSKDGGEEVCSALRQEVIARGLKGRVRINKAGCFDQCGNGPMVVVYPDSTWYAHVKPTDADQLLEHLVDGKPLERLLYDGRGRTDRS